ncbi:MAG: winged helix-turn-helix transcriptional regulator [Thaumarchaeota archaeon]|nr:winged helix-turn-helix transcriptional regulator [Nitrososphaerota archaeon]
MDMDSLSEVLSSPVKLKIEDAVSVRPRTLSELASVTGISVQGVLRHVKRLVELGVVEERSLVPTTPKARKVYAAKSEIVGDYSTPDLTVVKRTRMRSEPHPRARTHDLEGRAGDILIQRRRVRDQARRMARMIDDLVADREALTSALDASRIDATERLMLEVLFTEETLEDGVRVLSMHYGLDDRRSIDRALAKAKRIVGR